MVMTKKKTRPWFALRMSAFVSSLLVWTAPSSFAQDKSSPTMTPLNVGPFRIANAEYWIFRPDEAFRYPDDVTWGFYPEGVHPGAIRCAEQGFRSLKMLLENGGPELDEMVRLGGTRIFNVVVADYHDPRLLPRNRQPKLTHWNWGRDDFRGGAWRWETVYTRGGDCFIPRPGQAYAALRLGIEVLNASQ